jgi:hypothetical protein
MQRFFRLNKEIFELKSKLRTIESIGFLKNISLSHDSRESGTVLYKPIKEIDHHELLEAENEKTIFTYRKTGKTSRILIQGEYVTEVAVWGSKVFLFTESDDSLVVNNSYSFPVNLVKDKDYQVLVNEYLAAGWKEVFPPCYDVNNAEHFYVIKLDEPHL